MTDYCLYRDQQFVRGRWTSRDLEARDSESLLRMSKICIFLYSGDNAAEDPSTCICKTHYLANNQNCWLRRGVVIKLVSNSFSCNACRHLLSYEFDYRFSSITPCIVIIIEFSSVNYNWITPKHRWQYTSTLHDEKQSKLKCIL